MRTIKKQIKYIIIYLIIIVILHLILYKTDLNKENISNTLFVVGIISFLVGILVVTNSDNIFIGFNYYLKKLFSKNENRDFYEYKESKYKNRKSGFSKYMVLYGLVLLLVSLFLALRV